MARRSLEPAVVTAAHSTLCLGGFKFRWWPGAHAMPLIYEHVPSDKAAWAAAEIPHAVRRLEMCRFLGRRRYRGFGMWGGRCQNICILVAMSDDARRTGGHVGIAEDIAIITRKLASPNKFMSADRIKALLALRHSRRE